MATGALGCMGKKHGSPWDVGRLSLAPTESPGILRRFDVAEELRELRRGGGIGACETCSIVVSSARLPAIAPGAFLGRLIVYDCVAEDRGKTIGEIATL